MFNGKLKRELKKCKEDNLILAQMFKLALEDILDTTGTGAISLNNYKAKERYYRREAIGCFVTIDWTECPKETK